LPPLFLVDISTLFLVVLVEISITAISL
jgi:hypothetical protein